jgi:NAD(P)-dependent dehydrogenase (short-subunit alcohol dehydrogenase family)
MTKIKTALVCGGSSGIGAATVDLLLNQGITVYNLDIKQPLNPNHQPMLRHCDLTHGTEVNRVLRTILEEVSTVDYLFYNAGIHHNDYLEDTSIAAYNTLLATNVTGIFHVLKMVIPIMKLKTRGSIVLMSSEQSFIGRSKNPIYAMTKGAISQLTRSLAIDYAPFNIRVNCVSPGTTDTPMYRRALALAHKRTNTPITEMIAEGIAEIPLKRLAQPIDIARAVWFLLCEDNSYITGVNLPIDGGFIIS